jgi:hypothetical protein
MISKNPDCLLHAGPSPGEMTTFGARSIDSQTTQAFHQLRFHAEGLALELAVRLRVLGKSLAAVCPGQGADEGKRAEGSVTYQNLRQQLDGFLGSLVDHDFAGHRYLPAIRNFLQDSLPYEVNGCVGGVPCRIERVEAVISFLSDNICENEELTGGPTVSFSL